MPEESRSQTRYELNDPHVVAEIVDGEVVVVDLRSGAYFSLTHTAAFIWTCLTEGKTPFETAALIRSIYKDPEPDLDRSVGDFALKLVQEDLLRISSLKNPSLSEKKLLPASESYQPPMFEKFTDMKEFLLVDPIHEVNVRGWPHKAESAPSEKPSKDEEK